MSDDTTCPRCGGTEFREVDCGPDSYDDDITYTSDVCAKCGLWHDGWTDKWYADITTWAEVDEYADEWQPAKP